MSVSLSKRSFIVGGHITKFIGAKHPDFIWKNHPDYGKVKNPTLEDYIKEAVSGCLKNTSVAAAAVDKMWIGNFAGELFSNQGHLGAALVGVHRDLYNKPSMRVEGACASGGLAFSCALESIQAGSADVALVVGAEEQNTVSARKGGDYLARASHYSRQRGIDDFTFPALFARRIQACMKEFGYSHEDLGAISAKAYGNANLNPKAHMHSVHMDKEIASSSGDKNPCFLENINLKPFLRLSDCSQVSDGGAALIVVSEDGLSKIGVDMNQCIEVTGFGQATGNLYTDSDPTRMPTTAAAADVAFSQAGIGRDAIDVLEIHDCFTITEMLMMEALGFVGRGEGKNLVRNGDLELGGKYPCNTGGGLVGFGHPVGATGVKQVLEIHRQMKGACGDYQLKRIPEYGITSNLGGDDKTSVVSILRNC